MVGPPVISRSPRILPDLPVSEIEIPPPPHAPQQSGMSLVPLLLGSGGSLISMVLMALFNRSSNPWLYLVYSFTGVSSMAYAIYNYVSQRRVLQQRIRERQERYTALVGHYRSELEQLRDQQQSALCSLDPGPAECARGIRHPEGGLWGRTPRAADFLHLRCGLGAVPATFRVKTPKQSDPLNPDPLHAAAEELVAEFQQVSGVPIRLLLREVGTAGIVGPRPALLEMIRSLLIQLVAHHSPDEVKLAVLYPQSEAADWGWVRWLPHVWSDDRRQRFLAMHSDGAQATLGALYDVCNRRRIEQSSAQGSQPAPFLPHLVLVVAEPHLTERQPLLPLLLRDGASLGASVLFLAERREELPKECQGIVDLTSAPGQLILTAPERRQVSFTPDPTPTEMAEEAARAMAPLRLRQISTPVEVPTVVPLLKLFGVTRVEELDVLSRWRTTEANRSLAAPIGLRAGDDRLQVDLHERGHGPHGLVAGATGSGKSELLQSMIAAIAATYHPHDVVFVLVDYKGGGMANVFAEMPHLVGTITNLQGNLAARALSALKGELKRRQRLLAEAGVNHVDQYQRLRRKGTPLEPLPHLILVADEFAELKMEQPDFMRELISAVRVGRSLGVHLILATQKPAGVVDDQIWSNARFRLCLRVEQAEDSSEVLKRPDAASIRGAGRAYFQVGNNEVYELFQAAWGGAAYIPGDQVQIDPHEIAEISLEGIRRPLVEVKKAAAGTAESQLEIVIKHLAAAARQAGIERLPGPWLAELPPSLPLDAVRSQQGWDGQGWQPAKRWLEPSVGLLDDPAAQRQEPLRIPIGEEGHLSIYGGPGTGKTTLVQTLVTSLAFDHSPADVHFYLLDFGGRALTLFAKLPHVGAVVLPDEGERVQRLFRFLTRELDVRKERLAAAGVTTLNAYRMSNAEPLPAIVVVIDNYAGFTESYGDYEEMLAALAREGGHLGIHLVLTATTTATIRTRIASSISLTMAFQMTDRTEYSVVGRTGGLEPAPVAGRGLISGAPPLEFQAALPVPASNELELSGGIRALVQRMSQAWQGPGPRPIAVLPEVVPLSDLLDYRVSPGEAAAVPFGLEVGSLEPAVFDLNDGPYFMVAGPIQSGKTTLLQTLLLALATTRPRSAMKFYLVDIHSEGFLPLQPLPQVEAYITGGDALGEALERISAELGERRRALDEARLASGGRLVPREFLARYPSLVMAIDDHDSFLDGVQTETKERLGQLIRRERGMGFYLLVAGSTKGLSNWKGLGEVLKEFQTGFVVGSSEHGDLDLFNLRLPGGEGGKLLPPGQGFFVRRSRVLRMKVATAHAGWVRLSDWIDHIISREGGEK